MKFIRSIFILLLFLFSSVAAVYSQTSGNDAGFLNATIRVYNINKERLTGINLIYTDMETNQVLRKKTENGSAFIQFPLNKTFLLVVSSNMYYTKTIEINTNIRRMGNTPGFYSDIEITLLENCENNPARSNILEYPIGKIIYNDQKTKFEYDFAYTSEMADLYMSRYEERCKKPEEELKEEQIAQVPEDKKKEANNNENQPVRKERKKQKETAVVEQTPVEQNEYSISKNEEKEEKQSKITQQEEAPNTLSTETISAPTEEKPSIESSSEIKPASKTVSVADTVANQSVTPQHTYQPVSKKPEVFDQNKEFIYLQPKNSWPSELREYLLNPNYKPRAIGTFAYTQQEVKKEFYIDDVVELREKFPVQFDQAFKNWDYLVELYSKYRKK